MFRWTAAAYIPSRRRRRRRRTTTKQLTNKRLPKEAKD